MNDDFKKGYEQARADALAAAEVVFHRWDRASLLLLAGDVREALRGITPRCSTCGNIGRVHDPDYTGRSSKPCPACRVQRSTIDMTPYLGEGFFPV